MTAIDPSPLNTELCSGCDCTGFAPKIDYTIDPAARTVAWADSMVYPAADARRTIHVRVYDQNGRKVPVKSPAANGTINVASLQLSDLNITATVISTGGCKADLGSYHLGAGSLVGTLGAVALQGKRK